MTKFVLGLLFMMACSNSEFEPPEQTLEDGLALQRELNTTDLSVQMSASTNPVRAGSQLIYAFSVGNRLRLVDHVRAVISLPPAVSQVLGDSRCSASDSTITCELGSSYPHATIPWAAVVQVPVGLSGQMLRSEVTVHHYFVPISETAPIEGPDPNPQNNTATLTIAVN